jgi:VWFA-related protein
MRPLARRRRLALAALLPFVLGAAPQPPAETAGERPDETFFEALEVTLVNLDVQATDRAGRRVSGLTADDFEVREDGRPVALTHFAEIGPAAAAPAPAAPVAPQAAAPVAPQAAAAAGDRDMHVVLYFDNLFLRPFTRNYALAQIPGLLAKLDPLARVMVVTFERSLHVRLPFTRDRRAVLAALSDLAELSALGEQSARERRDVMQRVESSRRLIDAEPLVDAYAKAQFDDVVRSVRGLHDTVASLAGLPGRKALVHVSDGLPLTAAEDLFYLLDQKFGDTVASQLRANRYKVARELRELAARANANRVTFYTVEAAGMRAHESLSAEHGGSSTSVYIEIDGAREMNEEQPLLMLAADTGGLATLNTNNLDEALLEVAADLSSYYSLGYSPGHGGDGRYHTVEVRVKRAGVETRHRAGYRAKTPAVVLHEGTVAALVHGAERNRLGLELQFEVPTARADGHYLVPVLVRIPIAALALVPQGDQHVGRLQVALAVMDGEGRLSEIETTPVPIAIPAADLQGARGQFYVYAAQLLMARGDQVVGVGVRDDLAGELSFVRRPLRVGG